MTLVDHRISQIIAQAYDMKTSGIEYFQHKTSILKTDLDFVNFISLKTLNGKVSDPTVHTQPYFPNCSVKPSVFLLMTLPGTQQLNKLD